MNGARRVGVPLQVGHDGVAVERLEAVELLQLLVLDRERGPDLLAQDAGVEQVLDADADARGLVDVGRPDPALGGADLQRPEPQLGLRVEQPVPRHHEVGVAGDAQPVDGAAALLQARRARRTAPRGR